MTQSDNPHSPASTRKARFVSTREARRVRQPWQEIFHELLPQRTQGPVAPASLLADHFSADAPVNRKDPDPMQAYLTESPYYFSSKQLLPSGSIVFYSTKLRRYVHPTEGVLLEGHPRVQMLSEDESHTLAARWEEALARY